MTVGYSSVEDVCNAALRAVGYARPIGEIYEGSRAAKVASEVYGPARDAVMQSQNWDFALKDAALTATVGGVLILGFTHEYNYPSDALRIRMVHPVVTLPNNDPMPVRWTTGNDAALGTKVIFTNQSAAIAAYVAQITDPTKWNPAFTQAFIDFLAKIFAFALRDDLNLSKERAGMAVGSVAMAAEISDQIPPALPELMARAAAAAQQR